MDVIFATLGISLAAYFIWAVVSVTNSDHPQMRCWEIAYQTGAGVAILSVAGSAAAIIGTVVWFGWQVATAP